MVQKKPIPWAESAKPHTSGEASHPVLTESVMPLHDVASRAPQLEGVPTGVPGLDELFFTVRIDGDGRPQKVPLGGIPRYSVFNLTGVSDTGKSLMAEQFAIAQARRGEVTLFVTVETPAPFLVMSLRERARAMGVDPDTIDRQIVVIDAATHESLRDDLPTLLNTLAYAIRTYGARFTVIDSVTGLFESREMMARAIVRRLFTFMKKWHQTALFISQKRSGHEELSAEAAGGYAVSHIVDGSMVLAKRTIQSAYEERTYGIPIGETIRLFRIDGCRMCGHDTVTRVMEITATGLVTIRAPLSEFLQTRAKRRLTTGYDKGNIR